MHDFRKTTLFIACLCAGLAAPVSAKSLKCVDSKGVTHYGDNIPAGCSDKPVYELDDKGLVVKENPASLSPEQRHELEVELKRKQDEGAREKDQKRKDNALLSSYATEAEIDMAAERNQQQILLSIGSLDSRIQTARSRLKDYQKQAIEAGKDKKGVPSYIAENIRNLENEIGKLEAERAQKQQEGETIKMRFEADKKRYRELTQKQAPAQK